MISSSVVWHEENWNIQERRQFQYLQNINTLLKSLHASLMSNNHDIRLI